MAKLDFSSFRELLGNIDKESLYDAVKPELQAYAEHRTGGVPIDQAYALILGRSYRATDGEDPVPVIDDPVELVRRMGKGRDGQGKNYSAARVHVERIYYFFMFSNEIDPTTYGERISARLFGQSFFDEFARTLRTLGVERPNYVLPTSRVKLGRVELSLGDDVDLFPFRMDWHEKPKLIDDEGKTAVFAAMHWRSGLSQLHGRVEEYRKLWDWALDESKFVKTMLISGPGGAGKTRLAAEVVRNLISKKNWKGGFLLDGYDKTPCVYNGNGAGVVFVIDYPEEKTDVVKEILASAGNPVTYSRPIRIILLSRENRTAWLKTLNKIELDRFDETPLDLKRYVSRDDALEIASDVEAYYPDLIGQPKTAFSGVGRWLDTHETHRLPLNIIAASIHAVLDPARAFNLGGADVLAALAEWELRRVRYYSDRDLGDQNSLEKLLALSVFTQSGLTKGTVFELGEMEICPGKSGDSLLQAVRKTPYWQPKTAQYESHLTKLEPDRPAATFLLRALGLDDPSPGLPRWLIPTVHQDVDGFADRLNRLAFDIGYMDQEASRNLEQQCIAMLDLRPALVDQLQLIAYRGLRAFSAEFAIEICRRLLGRDMGLDTDGRAEIGNSLANLLSDLGRHDAALDANGAVVSIQRKLAASSQSTFSSRLAVSLNNRSCILAELRSSEPALEAINEAVSIHQQMADAGSDVQLVDWAIALSNQGNRLSELMRHEEALEATNKAVLINRQLAELGADDHQNRLAGVLNNQANRLANVGQDEAALNAVSEAVAIHRKLAEARPDVFLPNLALTLSTLAFQSFSLGQHEAASRAIDEAIPYLRQLANLRPDAFLDDLAKTLTIAAKILFHMGHHEVALEIISDAVMDYRQRPGSRVYTFLYELANCLEALANELFSIRQTKAALITLDMAVSVYRQLSPARPGEVLPRLAKALNQYSNRLADIGQHEDALKAIGQAILLYRGLAESGSNAFCAELAMALVNEADTLSEIEQHEAALIAVDQAVSIFRNVAENGPDTALLDVAKALNNKADTLSHMGKYETALDTIGEAISILRRLGQAPPDQILPFLAGALHTHANVLARSRQVENALVSSAAAVATLRPSFLKAHKDHVVMITMVRLYLHLCQQASSDPDMKLLQPILDRFGQV